MMELERGRRKRQGERGRGRERRERERKLTLINTHKSSSLTHLRGRGVCTGREKTIVSLPICI